MRQHGGFIAAKLFKYLAGVVQVLIGVVAAVGNFANFGECSEDSSQYTSFERCRVRLRRPPGAGVSNASSNCFSASANGKVLCLIVILPNELGTVANSDRT